MSVSVIDPTGDGGKARRHRVDDPPNGECCTAEPEIRSGQICPSLRSRLAVRAACQLLLAMAKRGGKFRVRARPAPHLLVTRPESSPCEAVIRVSGQHAADAWMFWTGHSTASNRRKGRKARIIDNERKALHSVNMCM